MSVAHNEGQVLLRLLVDSRFCPTRAYEQVHMGLLYRLAVSNKAEHLLLHFLTCTLCSRQLNEKDSNKLERIRLRLRVLPLVFEGERRHFEQILKKRHLRAILFKQYATRIRVGNDLDVLVSKKDFPSLIAEGVRQGYKKTAKVRHKEIQLTNPANRFKVDVHHILAFPQYGWLPGRDLAMIQRYSSDIFKETDRQGAGFVRVTIEWYVVSRMIHYWYNDMLCGLYPLYEITSFCYEYRNKIDWVKLFRIADSYSMRNEILFIFSLGRRILGLNVPGEVKRRTTFRITLLSAAITFEDIVYFPPISDWYHKRYSTIAQKKYSRYFFSKLLVNQDSRVTRLLRPRIILFILGTGVRYGWDIMKRIYETH